jgi:hypothetical protein
MPAAVVSDSVGDPGDANTRLSRKLTEAELQAEHAGIEALFNSPPGAVSASEAQALSNKFKVDRNQNRSKQDGVHRSATEKNAISPSIFLQI